MPPPHHYDIILITGFDHSLPHRCHCPLKLPSPLAAQRVGGDQVRAYLDGGGTNPVGSSRHRPNPVISFGTTDSYLLRHDATPPRAQSWLDLVVVQVPLPHFLTDYSLSLPLLFSIRTISFLLKRLRLTKAALTSYETTSRFHSRIRALLVLRDTKTRLPLASTVRMNYTDSSGSGYASHL